MTVSHATSKSETEESDTFVDWDDTGMNQTNLFDLNVTLWYKYCTS